MQVDDIRRLVKLVEESDIDELEVRRWWEFLRITKRARVRPAEVSPAPSSEAARPGAEPPGASRMTASVPAAPVTPAPLAVPAADAPREADAAKPAKGAAPGPAEAAILEGLMAIRSPMVGTFYRAPNPTAPPFVETGSRVAPRQVVCIVEAMKLMNEIEADSSGTIERILAENGKPVEYNQPLFLVRPD